MIRFRIPVGRIMDTESRIDVRIALDELTGKILTRAGRTGAEFKHGTVSEGGIDVFEMKTPDAGLATKIEEALHLTDVPTILGRFFAQVYRDIIPASREITK